MVRQSKRVRVNVLSVETLAPDEDKVGLEGDAATSSEIRHDGRRISAQMSETSTGLEDEAFGKEALAAGTKLAADASLVIDCDGELTIDNFSANSPT